MAQQFNVPLLDGTTLSFEGKAGQTVFILGANGTGKSSLLYLWKKQLGELAIRVTAHRQTWFNEDTIAMSPTERLNYKQNDASFAQNAQSRIRDPWAYLRPNAALYDLMEFENVRARNIAAAMDAGDIVKATALSKATSPLTKINKLFQVSNLPVQFEMHQGGQFTATRDAGSPYSVARLSDGERNALIIAAEVLNAPPGSVLLIDEPERHLHRSISSPLINSLMAERSDCVFAVSSHDITLASEYPDSKMLLLRDCQYSGDDVRWDANLLPPSDAIDDQLRLEILGARKKVLFVEGESQSLDKGLYALIFPNVSVIAKGACRNVQQSVTAIRASYNLHWLCPFGLIDNDNRTQPEIDSLKAQFIYALPHYSVESIYYHPEIQSRVAQRAASVTGSDHVALLSAAKVAGLNALAGQAKRMSERAILLKLRAEVMQQLPRSEDIEAGTPISIAIDTSAAAAAEIARFESLLGSQNLEELIRRYPLRHTGALSSIAKALGFQSRSIYESAVRKLLIDDQDALNIVKGLFGDLPSAMATA